MLVCEFFSKDKTLIMCQPPYSPDLALADFFLFAKLNLPMKGKCIANIEEEKKIETEAAGDSKKPISKGIRGLEKKAVISVLYLRRITLKGTRELLINK